MAYDFRDRHRGWHDQIESITEMGYHYYMTPETAQIGLEKFPTMNHVTGWKWGDYPDVSKAPLFNE